MWVAQLVSTIGDSFTMIASGIYVYRQTGSSLQVGLMLMATSIPTLFIGMIAGVIAGRSDLIRRAEKVQIDTGATIGPFDAFLVLRGIMTLAVRVERHARTARALAAWLERQDGVGRVLYPGLASHPQHEVAMRQFRPDVAGGMLAIELAGGREAGRAPPAYRGSRL